MSKSINEYSHSTNTINKVNMRKYYLDNFDDTNMLKEEILKLKLENSKLTEKENMINNLKKELMYANDKIDSLQTKIENLLKEHNKEISEYKSQMRFLTSEKDFQQLLFNKKSIIFDQKLNRIRDIEMENEVYRDEVSTLKDKNKQLEESVNLKKKELEVENKINFTRVKKHVMKELLDAKNDIFNLNSEKMEINNKIILMQNKNLIELAECQQKEIDKYEKTIKELQLKILDLKKEIDVNEKVQIKLATKLINKNNKSINLFNKSNIFNKYKKDSLTLKKNSLIDNNKNEDTFFKSNILNTTSTNAEQYNSLLKKEKISKDKIHKINIDSIINNDSNNNYPSLIYPLSRIERDKIHIFNSDKKGNSKDYQENNLKSSSFEHKKSISKDEEFIRQSLTRNNKILTNEKSYFFQKKKIQLINEKNCEINFLKTKIDNLKNKFNFYENKYKKLIDFLEESINNFFFEIKEKGKNFSLNFEEIKKCNFENFTKEEKYSILVILINNLLPLVINNFNSNFNIGDNVFKTNINIYDKTFNKNISYFNDNFLRKAFLKKNRKLQKELYIKNNTFSHGVIPILRKINLSPEYKINDDKYRLLLD